MEFNDAALPVVRLRTRPLFAVHPHATADRWREAMEKGGLLTEVFEETNGDEDPREGLKSCQAKLKELAELDVKRARQRGELAGVQWGDAPWWAWLLVVGEPVVASLLGAGDGDSAAHHLVGALLIYVLPAIGALGLFAYGWARYYRRRADTILRLEELNHERMGVLRAMKRDIAWLAKRSFVARVGNRVVLSTADLDWVRRQARAARGAGQLDLARQLDAEGDRIEDAVKAALFVPPRNWSQSGMVADRDRWVQLLAGAGLAA